MMQETIKDRSNGRILTKPLSVNELTETKNIGDCVTSRATREYALSESANAEIHPQSSDAATESCDFAAIISGTMRNGKKEASPKYTFNASDSEIKRQKHSSKMDPSVLSLDKSPVLSESSETSYVDDEASDSVNAPSILSATNKKGKKRSLEDILNDIRTDTERLQSALRIDKINDKASEMVTTIQNKLDLHLQRFVEAKQEIFESNPMIVRDGETLRKQVENAPRNIEAKQTLPLGDQNIHNSQYLLKRHTESPALDATSTFQPIRIVHPATSVTAPNGTYSPQSLSVYQTYPSQPLVGHNFPTYAHLYPPPGMTFGSFNHPYIACTQSPQNIPLTNMTTAQTSINHTGCTIGPWPRPERQIPSYGLGALSRAPNVNNLPYTATRSDHIIPNYQSHTLSRSRKRPRRKSDDVVRCQQCGTTSTPEWRRGPSGFRTLCNACGLFHAKVARKKGNEEANRSLRQRPTVAKHEISQA